MPNRFPEPPLSWHNDKDHLRAVALAVRDTMRGRVNNVYEVTLEALSTDTLWLLSRFTPETVVLLSPKTASAAAVVGLYCVSAAGQVTIYHDSSPSTDRTFGAVLLG